MNVLHPERLPFIKMKSHYLLFIFISLTTLLSAQSRWGVEFKASRFNTSNGGQLESLWNSIVLEEGDLVTNSFTLGIIYRLNDRNLLKFHQGFHQNGSTITVKSCSDMVGDCHTYSDFEALHNYFQLAPSYTYRIIDKRIIIPIEVGININVRTKEWKEFYPGNKKFNYDYEVSTGIDYRIIPGLIMGLHALFTGNISEYQSIEESGTYKPKSLGLEFSTMYEFGK